MSLILKVDVLEPEKYTLEQLCAELVQCAAGLNISVEAPFKGTTILAEPTSLADDLVADFRRRLQKHREDQKNFGIFSMAEQVKYKGM